MPSLSFVTAYPHLKNKLAETLTDAIRASRLRANGYRVTVSELTDPENTPKNTLIRAIKVGDADPARMKDYEDTLTLVLGDGARDYLADVGKGGR